MVLPPKTTASDLLFHPVLYGREQALPGGTARATGHQAQFLESEVSVVALFAPGSPVTTIGAKCLRRVRNEVAGAAHHAEEAEGEDEGAVQERTEHLILQEVVSNGVNKVEKSLQ